MSKEIKIRFDFTYQKKTVFSCQIIVLLIDI